MKLATYMLAAGMMVSLLPSQASAQSPSLTVGGKDSKEVYLKDLNIQVDVVGTIATTTMTMVFQNSTSKILEAELLFPLPEGVTVSRYALDINGRMREAVPVDKAKGTQVFEEIERRRVDPGLLERVEGNNFRTRIYPVPARGSRTITVAYEEQLAVSKGKLAYRLPMDYKSAIDNFTLKASVWEAAERPKAEGGMAGDVVFDKVGNAYVSELKRTSYLPSKLLSFSLPYNPSEVKTLMQPASGSYYFTASCTPEGKVQPKVWGDVLGIVWDVSFSMKDKNSDDELALIDAIVRQKKNLTVKLALLNNRFTVAGTFTVKDGNWSELRKAIERLTYDGGTSYAAMELHRIPADEYILFSDGMSTLSSADLISKPSPLTEPMHQLQSSNFGKPVHTVVSVPKADYSTLKWISQQSGGKFINLNRQTNQEAVQELMNETLQFIGIKPNSAVSEVYPSIPTPVGSSFSLAGIASQEKIELVLQFGYGGKVTMEKKVALNASTQSTKEVNVHRVWAQKKIAELDMRYEKNKEEITELGQEFGIVTRNTSLIVLETINDYMTYEIAPPAEMASELAEYNRWMKERVATQQNRVESLLEEAINSANELKKWWDKEFVVKKPKYPKPDKANGRDVPPPVPLNDIVVSEEMVIEDEDMMLQEVAYVAAPRMVEAENIAADDVMYDMVEVADVRYAERQSEAKKVKEAGSSYTPQAQARIRLTDIKQDKDYLKNLTGKPDQDYASYLSLRATYGSTPDFFFDMASWFMKHGDKEKALRVLTCIADLSVENASLFRLLGYRLKEYGEYALEVYVCKKVIDWRPMDAQSYRDYALALTDAGRTQEGLDMLYSTLTQSYAKTLNSMYSGIEEVVATEINQLAALNKRLNVSEIDSKLLVGPMPVDIRVVIGWNMNNTDIDLHVTDPNGETCFYGHKETAIGGRISRDITQGYGPEQFMLKKAVKGTYKVFVNYFGDSQVKEGGPSTILVEIYTSYSDASQKREVVTLQLDKNVTRDPNSGLVQVAEFEF